jgi:hypothetical protein
MASIQGSDNIDDLLPSIPSLIRLMTDNAIAIAKVTTLMENTSVKLIETNIFLQEFVKETRDLSKNHESRILVAERSCMNEERIKSLEACEHIRSGAKPVIDRIYNIVQSVLIAVVVVIIIYFMKGGTIV